MKNIIAFIIFILILFAGLLIFKPYRYQPIPNNECCYFLDTWTGQPYKCIWSLNFKEKKGKYICSKHGNVSDMFKVKKKTAD